MVFWLFSLSLTLSNNIFCVYVYIYSLLNFLYCISALKSRRCVVCVAISPSNLCLERNWEKFYCILLWLNTKRKFKYLLTASHLHKNGGGKPILFIIGSLAPRTATGYLVFLLCTCFVSPWIINGSCSVSFFHLLIYHRNFPCQYLCIYFILLNECFNGDTIYYIIR